jgi:hypothetical protein
MSRPPPAARRGGRGRLGRGLAAALLGLISTADARACAVCACGDPTLTAFGAEQPFAGRVRLSAELQARTDAVGEPGVGEVRLSEQLLALGLAWAPHDRWQVGAALPLGRRVAEDAALTRTTLYSTGDAELRARVVAWRRHRGAGSALLSPTFGLRLPTAPVSVDGAGEPLPMSAQLGGGSVAGLAGLQLLRTGRPWTLYASATGLVSAPSRFPSTAGPSLRATANAQWQPGARVGLRGGVDARADRPARLAAGGPEPDTGGFVAFASGDLLISPVEDLSLRLGASIPFVQALTGFHEEGPAFTLGAALDL